MSTTLKESENLAPRSTLLESDRRSCSHPYQLPPQWYSYNVRDCFSISGCWPAHCCPTSSRHQRLWFDRRFVSSSIEDRISR